MLKNWTVISILCKYIQRARYIYHIYVMCIYMQTMATEITHARLPRSFSCTSRTVTPVQFVRGRGFNPNWLRTTPYWWLKFGLGVEFNPHRKVRIPNSSLNHYKLMSSPKTLCSLMVCRLTDVLMSVSPSVTKNTVITYLSLHLIAYKTFELAYENVPECTILKWKKSSQVPPRWGGGHPLSKPLPSTPPRLFWQNRTLTVTPHVTVSSTQKYL